MIVQYFSWNDFPLSAYVFAPLPEEGATLPFACRATLLIVIAERMTRSAMCVILSVVIAGLDPATHDDARKEKAVRKVFIYCISS
jgi:hypothetical protein